ncbi:MAG: hypothetical protein WBV55_10340 [Candidatus Sulfotelmatobacter sp.]|jgi:hypothetical protein
MALEPPPEQEFDELESAKDFINLHAEQHGYALTKDRDRFTKRGELRRVDYRCDKGGKKRGEGVVRQSSTRMTECPLDIRIYRTAIDGSWKVTVVDGSHNHESSTGPEQHSKYRKPTETEHSQIADLTRAGVAPKFIVRYLQQRNPDTKVASKEVYNAKVKNRKERLQENTPIEALILELTADDENWALKYGTDDGGHVNLLFYAHHTSIELIQSYPDVILIDATYKVNIYNMPMIHFLGIAATGQTFSIAFCFVSAENDLQYHTAIAAFKTLVIGEAKVEVFLTDDEAALKNALAAVFPTVPQLLCLWHINKRVQTKVQTLWRVNNVSEEENKVNKEKRKEFMARWQQASSDSKVK